MILEKLFGAAVAVAETVDATVATTDAAAMEEVSTAAALISSLLPMVLIFVVFYFFLIRPQKKKDKKIKDMLAALKVGDRVCTIGGIYGTIVGIKDDTVTLAVGKDNVNLVFARWGIRNVEEVSVENDSEVLN